MLVTCVTWLKFEMLYVYFFLLSCHSSGSTMYSLYPGCRSQAGREYGARPRGFWATLAPAAEGPPCPRPRPNMSRVSGHCARDTDADPLRDKPPPKPRTLLYTIQYTQTPPPHSLTIAGVPDTVFPMPRFLPFLRSFWLCCLTCVW